MKTRDNLPEYISYILCHAIYIDFFKTDFTKSVLSKLFTKITFCIKLAKFYTDFTKNVFTRLYKLYILRRVSHACPNIKIKKRKQRNDSNKNLCQLIKIRTSMLRVG